MPIAAPIGYSSCRVSIIPVMLSIRLNILTIRGNRQDPIASVSSVAFALQPPDPPLQTGPPTFPPSAWGGGICALRVQPADDVAAARRPQLLDLKIRSRIR